jgi:hypothetical protein
MADKTDTPISIRIPSDLRAKIEEYAKDNKLFRAGNPNLSGALIMIAREFFGGNVAQSSSDNVAQSSAATNTDIEARITTAIDKQLSDIKERILDEHSSGVRGISGSYERLLEDVRKDVNDLTVSISKDMITIDERLEALETNRSEASVPANFTPALLQRAKEVAPIMLMNLPKAM